MRERKENGREKEGEGRGEEGGRANNGGTV